MPIRRAKHEVGEVAIGGPRIRRGPDPNTDLLYRGGDLGGNLAMEIIVEEPGRLGWVDTLDCRLDLVDLDIERVAGRVDTVAEVDHARDLGDLGGDLASRFQQNIWVVRKQLHLDR